MENKYSGGRYPCDLLWTTLAISAEGHMMYCCHDYKLNSNLSMVTEKSLKDIWIKEINQERKCHIENKIVAEPCLHCEAWLTRARPMSLKDRIMRKMLQILKGE